MTVFGQGGGQPQGIGSARSVAREIDFIARDRASRSVSGSNIIAGAVYAIPGSVIGAVDTVGQSVGLFEEDTVTRSMQQFDRSFGTLGVADAYAANRSGYRMIGDVATTFAGYAAITKVLRSPAILRGTTALTARAPASVQRFTNIGTKVLFSDQSKVAGALTAYEKQAGLFGKVTTARNFGMTTTGKRMSQQVRLAQLKNDVVESVATEAFVLAAQNESELFFPEGVGLKDLAFSGGLGVGLPAALGQFALTPALRRAAGAAGVAADKETRPYIGNAGFDLLSGVYAREDMRVRQGTDAFQKINENDRSLGQQTAAIEAEADRMVQDSVERLGNAAPFGMQSSKVKRTPEVTQTMRDFAESNPRLTTSLVAIEKPEFADEFADYVDQRIVGIQVEKAKLSREIAVIKQGSPEQLRKMAELRALDHELIDLTDNYIVTRINSLGIASGNLNSKTVFDETATMVTNVDTSKDVKFANRLVVTHGSDNRRIGFSLGGGMFREGDNLRKNAKHPFQGMGTADGLTPYDRSKLIRSIPRALDQLGQLLDDMARGGSSKLYAQRIVIPRGTMNVEQLNYVNAAVERYGFDNPNLQKIIGLDNFANADDLRAELINAQYRRYLQRVGDAEKLSLKGIEADFDLAMELMVPSATDYDRYSPAIEWFDSLRMAGMKEAGSDLRSMFDSFNASISVGSTAKTVEELSAKQDGLFDKVFNFDVAARIGSEGSPRAPVTVVSKRISMTGVDNWHVDWTSLASVEEAFRVNRHAELLSEIDSNPFVRHLGGFVNRIRENQLLVEDIRNGVGTISADQGRKPAFGRIGEVIPTSLDFSQRHVPAASSASTLNDVLFREASAIGRRELSQNAKAMMELLQPKNASSKFRYLDYESAMMRRWEIDRDALEVLDEGRVRLNPDSERNKEIARQMGLDEVPEFLPSVYVEDHSRAVMLDDLAHRALLEDNRFANMRYFGDSSLMKANGMGALRYREGHTMAPSRYQQEMVFLQNARGEVIDFELGETIELAEARLNSRAARLSEHATTRIVTRKNIEDWHQANDRAWNDSMLDMTDAWNQTSGGSAEGGRTGVILSDDYIKSKFDAVSNMFTDQARRFLATEFRGELTQLEAMHRMSGLDQGGLIRDSRTGKREQAWSNAYQKFASQLLGRNINNPGSAVRLVNDVTENFLDDVINTAVGLYRGVRSGGVRTPDAAFNEAFEKLSKDYEFDPIAAAESAVAREFGGNNALTSRGISREVAKATTFFALQLFEPAHALLTTASILTTAPHTASFLRKAASESDAAYRQRVGVIGQVFEDGNSQARGAMPNEFKLVISTMQKFWRGDYADVLVEAEKRGYLTAHVSEFMGELSGPVRKDGVGKIVDLAKRGIKQPTQWSEDFARKFTFLMGYELFSGVGKKGRHIALAAANDFANKAIADYRPSQRSEMFRGAAGIQLGLFQTFGINYLQRLAVGLENKQARAVFMQAGTQAFVFGMNGVPGWSAFNESVLSTWDHTARPEDNFRAMENKGLSDVFLYGTLANLPRMLGLEPISLHTRGEIQAPRVNNLQGWSEVPAAVMGKNFLTTIGSGLGAVTGYGDMGSQRFYESLALASPNRPIRGVIERFALGYSTNKYGDITSGPQDEFNSFMGTVSRVMGLRPMDEIKRADALWRDSQTKLARRNKMDRLRQVVAAHLRSGKGITGDQAAMVIEDYIAYGGNPKYVRSWLKRLVMKSAISKFDREMMKKLNSSQRGRDVVNFVTSVDDANADVMWGRAE